MIKNEVWKDINGYEGLYQVSDLGRVKSFEREYLTGKNGRIKISNPEKIQKQYSTLGYNFLRLCKNGKTKLFRVHRLVAIAFIENPNNYTVINHKDGVRDNNLVENLEWCTQAHNVSHAYKIGLNKGRAGRNVVQLSVDGLLIEEFEKISDAVLKGFRHDCIVACCRGKHKEHKGYKWAYQ